jgi:hypothetical protein
MSAFIDKKIKELENSPALKADAKRTYAKILDGSWWDLRYPDQDSITNVNTWSRIREIPARDSEFAALSHHNAAYNFWLENYRNEGAIPEEEFLKNFGIEGLPYPSIRRPNYLTREEFFYQARKFWAAFIGIDEFLTKAGVYPTFEEILFNAYLNSSRYLAIQQYEDEIRRQQNENLEVIGQRRSLKDGVVLDSGETKIIDQARANELDRLQKRLKEGVFDEFDVASLTGIGLGDIIRRARVNQQALLSNFLEPFKEANRIRQEGILLKSPGNQEMYMLDGNPLVLVNKMIHNQGADEFVNIKTSELSSLVPMIRLFKVYRDKDKKTRQVEISFDTFTNVREKKVLDTRRASSVGIKSFDWSLNATDPATIRDDIEAKLVLYFQSFDDLTRDNGDFQYQDLLVRPAVDRRMDEDINDPSFYEIKAVVGWHPLDSTKTMSKSMLDACTNQQLALFLTLKDHEFNFTQQGTFELTITYRGRLEQLVQDPRFDVLSSEKGKNQIDKLREELSMLQKRCESDRGEGYKKRVKELEELIANIKVRQKDEFAQSLMTTMTEDGNIHLLTKYTIQDLAELTDFEYIPDSKKISQNDVSDSLLFTEISKETGDSRNESLMNINYDSQTAEEIFEKLEQQQNQDDTGVREIMPIAWFYFGDLVKAAIKHTLNINRVSESNNQDNQIIQNQIAKNVNILLGSITVNENNAEITVNLADLPISMNLFTKWFNTYIVEPERSNLPFIQFMRSAVKNLAIESLRSPASARVGSPKAGVFIDKSTTFSIPSNNPGASSEGQIGQNPLDKFGKPSGEQSRFIKAAYEELGISKDITIIETAESTHIIKIDEMNLLNSSNIIGDRTQVKNMTIDNSYHCMMFYVQTDVGFGKLSGNFKDDRENGVQHLYIGADRGILKEANFSKNEQPFLREARTQLNGLNPLAQLAATYDVNLKLVGNTIFWPGQYVYISPIGFGTGLGEPQTRGSISNQLGLGGYHLITNVQCYIESGKFETSVKALFETSGDGRSNIDREIDKNKTCKDN